MVPSCIHTCNVASSPRRPKLARWEAAAVWSFFPPHLNAAAGQSPLSSSPNIKRGRSIRAAGSAYIFPLSATKKHGELLSIHSIQIPQQSWSRISGRQQQSQHTHPLLSSTPKHTSVLSFLHQGLQLRSLHPLPSAAMWLLKLKSLAIMIGFVPAFPLTLELLVF